MTVRPGQASDPFAVLGVPPSADADALRTARRRLAMAAHPDRGGSAARMRAINTAFEEAMAMVAAGPATAVTVESPPPPPAPTPESEVERRRATRGGGRLRVERDDPSFVIEALPAEAFEALLVVASWMGEVIVDDPPYLLEVHLDDPAECWCRLELLPEAGASTVMLMVAGVEGEAPPIEAVRDRWVANLNQLGTAD
jgi:hypothetical protein